MRSIPTANFEFDLNIIEDSFPIIQQCLAEYGDIVRVKAKTRKEDSIILNHPEMIKRVLINNNKNYKKGVGFERVRMLLGQGLITSDGDFWRQQRRQIQPSFHREVLANMMDLIHQANIDLSVEWQTHADQQTPIDITEATSKITLEVVLMSIFGEDYASFKQLPNGNPFAILLDHGNRDLQFAYKFKQLHKLIADLIEQRRKREVKAQTDFLGLFMHSENQAGEKMPLAALVDEIVTLIVAGHETTAMTLNWCWYLLASNPEAEAKFHQQIDQFDKQTISPADFAELDYLRQIMEETLRLYPPVWLLTRQALADDVLADYPIATNEQCFISPYFMHRHADFWPDAERFDPSRFATKNLNEMEKQRNRYAYLPFSLGPRRCIGDYFAEVEMYVHLVLMGRQFKLSKLDENPVELAPNINLLTRAPIMMRISNR